jgi:hydrogenase nickel incorporation protein HypB
MGQEFCLHRRSACLNPQVVQSHATLATAVCLRKLPLLAVLLDGPAGGGKTSLIEATGRLMRGKLRMGAAILHPAASRDAELVSRYCRQVQHCNTIPGTAPCMGELLRRLQLDNLDLLLIETAPDGVGVPPLGQDLTVMVISAAEADERAIAREGILEQAAALVINKVDLQRQIRFDRSLLRQASRQINPNGDWFEVSAFEHKGLERWTAWLEEKLREKRASLELRAREGLPHA